MFYFEYSTEKEHDNKQTKRTLYTSTSFSLLGFFDHHLDLILTLHQVIVVIFCQKDTLLCWRRSTIVQLYIFANIYRWLAPELKPHLPTNPRYFIHSYSFPRRYRYHPSIFIVITRFRTILNLPPELFIQAKDRFQTGEREILQQMEPILCCI